MADRGTIRQWLERVVLVAGAVLVLARFVTYIDVVSDADVSFANALTWWAIYAAGIGLFGIGALSMLEPTAPGARRDTGDLLALLVGLLILVIMPGAPGFSFNFGSLFGP